MATPDTPSKPAPRQIAPEIERNAEERRVISYEITPRNPTPQTQPKLIQASVDSAKNHGQEIFVQCLYMLPVVGNAMSLYDVGTDIYRICSNPGESKRFTAWGILAIDAIGVIPAAGNASRPARAVVKEVLLAFAKGATAAVLVDLFWATAGGDAIAFMEQLDEKLKGWLASIDSGIAQASRTVRRFVENPVSAGKQMGLIKENTGFFSWVPTGEEITLYGVDELLKLSGQRETILKWLDGFDANRSAMLKQAFGDVATAGTLIFMAAQVVAEIKRRKALGIASHTAHAAPGTMHEPHVKPGEHRETTQKGAKASELPAKNGCGCPATASKRPINYAMGDENLEQTDFALDGMTPIVWTRRYRSSLAAYDASALGARWTSPYHLSLDEHESGALTFFDPDARAVPLPAVAVGDSIDVPAEQFTIGRIDSRCIKLSYPDGSFENYERSRTVKSSRYRLVARTGRDGLGLKFAYNERDELTGITDGAENTIRIENLNGRVAAIYRIGTHGGRDEAIARYTYSAEGDLIEHRDVLHHARKYVYQHHLLTRYTDFNGNPANLEWDALGQSAATSAQSRCVRTWIAKDQELDRETNIHALAPKEDTRFEYHRGHWYTKVTDGDGNATIHRYDQHNRIVLVEHPDGSSDSFNWNENNQLVSTKNALGQVQRFEYDAQGRVTAVTDALTQTTRTEYDDAGLPVKVTSPTGDVTTTAYDALGRPVAVTDAAGRTTQYSWNSHGRLISLTDPKGGTRQFDYDGGGHLVKATDCSNNATQYAYDERGYLSRVSDAEGNETAYLRDARGQIQRVTRADGTVEMFTWDRNGNLLTYRDGAGTETEYWYDQLNQLGARKTRAVHGDWGGIRYDYDRQGKLVKLRNENNESTTFRYDTLGQLIEQTGFDGRSVRYEWDDAGGLAASTEGDVETRYERDPVGRLIARKIGKHAIEQFYYDARGRLVTAKGGGAVTRLHYDDADNLVAEEQHVHPCFRGRYSTVTRHEYDILGNRTKTVLPNTRTVDWLRYGSGHVHGALLDGKPLVDFERDKLHREVKRTHRSFTQTRQYDRVGRLAQMSVRHASSAHLLDVLARRAYQYSAAGHLTRIDDHARGVTDYTYDPIGRLLKSVTPDLTEIFAFDPAGNPVDPEKVPPRPVVETDEQRAERHAREDAEDAATKRAGQVTPMRWRGSEDADKFHAWQKSLPKCIGNVLKELNRTQYAYDERGNLSRKTERNGVTWIYDYDTQNRLKGAKRYAKPPAANELSRSEKTPEGGTRWISSTAPFELAASFTYDAFGRRVAKEVSRATGATELTVFTWDGDVLLMEERFEELPHEYGRERKSANARYEMVREEAQDADSLPVAQRMHTLDANYQWMRASLYLHEPGTFVPLARLDETLVEPAFLATGTDGGFVQVPAKSRHATVFYQNDHLGTPQELLDESGKVVWLARYKAWGGRKPTPYGKTDAAETDNAIRFQGQYFDDETGLAYNRHRYYDPQSGRFITPDPIGLAGGINVYQFANANPIRWTDPLGLSVTTPPTISAADITDKTRTEIRDLANRTGLVVAKQDSSGAPIKWKCPCTGKERLRLDRGHIDQTTGLRYSDPKAAVDHVHAYDPTGKVKVVSPVDGNPHFPTTGE